jgi:hypothetical protein
VFYHFILLKYLCLGIYRVLTFVTPHSKWWPQYLYCLNLVVINCCFTLHRSIAEKCRRVKLSLLRNLFRYNEFLVIQASICYFPHDTMGQSIQTGSATNLASQGFSPDAIMLIRCWLSDDWCKYVHHPILMHALLLSESHLAPSSF